MLYDPASFACLPLDDSSGDSVVSGMLTTES